jgi:tetratricopeptide (TPR) repeat protein
MSLDNEKAIDLLGMALIKVKNALKTPAGHQHNTVAAALNKWAAILENAFAERVGSIKARVEGGLAFEKFTRKALELSPNDATLHYMLGKFYFNIAALSWFERQAAKAISGKEPPKGDILDALKAFQKALDLSFSPAFSLEVARCHLQLKDKKSAKDYLLTTKNFTLSNSGFLRVEEEDAILEATELLTNL